MTIGGRYTRLRVSLFLGLMLALLSACGMLQKERTEAAAEQARPLSDGEIIAVLHALNQGEIRQAELAMRKSDDLEVLTTAREIIVDHRQSDQRTMALAAIDDITPQENALSRSLEQQAQQTERKCRNCRAASSTAPISMRRCRSTSSRSTRSRIGC